MRIYDIIKLLRGGFGCRHKWQQTPTRDEARLHYRCARCGREEVRPRTLPILLPERFTVKMNEEGGR